MTGSTPSPGAPTNPATPTPTPAPPPSAGAGSTPPVVGGGFWVNPNDQAVQQVNALRAQGDATEANQLETIAAEPEATWLTDATSGSEANVAALTGDAAAEDRTPIFVVYDLPGRDCGSYSSGGAASPAAYESFIDGVTAGIGQQPVDVIVEPDALSNLSCMPSSTIQLLQFATQTLTGDRRASVYVDAGNPTWQPAGTEASGLNQVISGTGAGFAVNVSNFSPLSADIAYGTSISGLTHGAHFVVDTSRSGGTVVSGQWCNPAGARLGPDPTTVTGDPLVDAEMWIKAPGESDGSCNGGPSAGQFWPAYALSLLGD